MNRMGGKEEVKRHCEGGEVVKQKWPLIFVTIYNEDKVLE